MGKRTNKKHAKKKTIILSAIINWILAVFVIFIPVFALILYVLGVQIPKIVFGIYISIVFFIAGILIVLFTLKEKLGFAEEGWSFGRRTGFKWLSKKEAKVSSYIFGVVMIALGILFAFLTAHYCK